MGKAVRLWIGPAVAVVVLAGLVLALRSTGGGKPSGGGAAKKSPTLINVHPSDVTRVTMTAGGRTLTLVRGAPPKGKTGLAPDWHVGTATGPAASGTNVESLLFGVEPLTATRSVAIAPAKAGLRPPAKVLSLDLKDGTKTVLDIGAAAPVGGYYARVAGAREVYLISSSLPDLINPAASAWLPPKKPASPAPSQPKP